jgi:hypothetical protein
MTDMKLPVLVALLHLLAYVTAAPQILTDNSFGNQVQVTLCHDFNYNEDASPADSIACQETRLLTPGQCYSISDAAPGSSWIWADGLHLPSLIVMKLATAPSSKHSLAVGIRLI